MPLQQIETDLFVHEDSCKAYVIRRGNRAIAIDFGTGALLEEMPSIGVSHLDWILHTHHHRDQCVGDHLALPGGTRIGAPEWEAHYFREAEHFWGRRTVFHLYNMRGNFNTLREPVPVEAFLSDFDTFEWEDITLEVVPAPGHTRGQIALVWHRPDSAIAFVGDMIHGDGRALTLYDLQNDYGQWQGMYQTVAALGYMQTFSPAKLYPSHGDTVDDPPSAVARLSEAMEEWLRFYRATPPLGRNLSASHVDEVLPGLYRSRYSNATHWALLSRSGKALFIDYGANFNIGLERWFNMPEESDRFIPYSIAELEALGMTSVDVIIPTHCHDDHVPGLRYLQRKHGTRLWCLENMARVFECPCTQILGCTVPRPARVDRILYDRQEVQWEEFTLTIRHTPGHALHHQSVFTEIAGKRVAFMGDIIFERSDRDERGRMKAAWNLIPMNRLAADDHRRTAEIMLEHEPELICPGHGTAFTVTRDDLEEFRDCVARIPEKLGAVVGHEAVNRALDFHWMHVTPYETHVAPGMPFSVEVTHRNHDQTAVHGVVRPSAPEGWLIEPTERAFTAEPGAEAVTRFKVTPGERTGRGPAKMPFAFRLELDGKDLGEACVGIGNYHYYPYHGHRPDPDDPTLGGYRVD